MSITAKATYLGDLRTEWEHIKSGNKIVTDAPTDNNGKGQSFSPSDTVATALAGCMMTIMGIKARDLDIDLTGMTAEITKHMGENPRRIAQIDVFFQIPVEVNQKHKTILENAAKTCPIGKSLHPEIVQNIEFHWKM
ncbi:OsmC family protein [Capnocytophaga canimorsus]|uniref:OsmC family protein n=1 Tax=Capnocytophaga canimorsus TaxID=28188 RepID=UPI0037CD5A7A